jgi:hypothetical protein
MMHLTTEHIIADELPSGQVKILFRDRENSERVLRVHAQQVITREEAHELAVALLKVP